MPRLIRFLIAVIAALPLISIAATFTPLDRGRIADVTTFLTATPTGPGSPISDRNYWTHMGKIADYRSQIAAAKQILLKPLPEQPDELYLEFSRTGNRKNFERVAFERRNRVGPLVLAECLENKGTYLPALEKLINALCDEKSWTLPAHDRDLTNFNGTTITIDLFSSALAWELALTDRLLTDKLQPATRARIKSEIKRRIIVPYLDMIHGERKQDWWIIGTNNWNSVCLAGVTGCALLQLESPLDRAEFITAAEQYIQYFLSGFTPDGYCSEGVGYWNYGFGNFALLSEVVSAATSGKIDFMTWPAAIKPASYGRKIEIINDVSPSFADCSIRARPANDLMWLLNRKYGWGLQEYAALRVGSTFGSLHNALICYDFSQTPSGNASAENKPDNLGIRTYFPDAGVYIGRPQKIAPQSVGVALKGGNNNESHNHNDIGSYIVVDGKTPILLDPGAEVYTRRTFSKDRYDSKLLNSYGHAVPRVAGKLQAKGEQSRGKIISTEFTKSADTIVMDISSAYRVRSLKKLIRTFRYVRGANPSFSVSDHVEFSKPESFETALISAGEFNTDNNQLVTVKQGNVSANVAITASAAYGLTLDKIEENAPVKPNRLAIKFSEPVTSATVTTVFRKH